MDIQSTSSYLEKLTEFQTILVGEKDKRLKYLCSLFNGMKSHIEDEY